MFGAAALVLFVALWIVVPAPTYALLPLGVGAPESSAWLLVGSLFIGILALVDIRRHTAARGALVLAAVAMLLASLPLARIPGTVRRFDVAMREELGDGYLRRVPAEAREEMRARPVAFAGLFLGIQPGEGAGEEDIRITRDVLFAAPGGTPLTLDVYRPHVAGRFPVVMQIHGGAWRGGSPDDNAAFARYLAERGYVVFAISYRLAPRFTWQAQLDDVRLALEWVREHAGGYHGDTSRVALAGWSAGAHLAMLLAYEREMPAVDAVVNYYGPVDLAEAYRSPPEPDPIGVREVLRGFVGGMPDQLAEQYTAASPITHVSNRAPPTLLIYGGRDHIVEPRFGRMLHEGLQASGAKSVLLEIPWAEHAFDRVPYGPSGQLSLYYAERFLAWGLKGGE